MYSALIHSSPASNNGRSRRRRSPLTASRVKHDPLHFSKSRYCHAALHPLGFQAAPSAFHRWRRRPAAGPGFGSNTRPKADPLERASAYLDQSPRLAESTGMGWNYKLIFNGM